MKRTYAEEQLPEIASEVLASLSSFDTKATVVGLSGPLGAGKTSLTKAIAKELGVGEVVNSPTFVIAKWYTPTQGPFDTIVHIDAYRIDSESELEPLGFSGITQRPNTLVIIEWPERLPQALTALDTQTFILDHKDQGRTIEGPYPHET